jgi:hypothetical protein
MAGFDEVRDVSSLAALLAVELNGDPNPGAVLNLLRDAPNAEEYLRVRVEMPKGIPGTMQMLVPRTRIFFNLERSKQLWGDAMVAVAVFAMTQSAPAAFFAATARKVYDNLVILSEDETEVVHDFFTLTAGRPYQTPVKEEALRARFAETLIPLDEVLDHLERKGIVTTRRGGLLSLVL